MMSLDSVLTDVYQAVPGCVAAGFLNTDGELLLGAQARDDAAGVSSGEIEWVAWQGGLFEGVSEELVGATFSGDGMQAEPRPLRELVVVAGGSINVLVQSATDPELVLLVVCLASADLTKVLSTTRKQLSAADAGLTRQGFAPVESQRRAVTVSGAPPAKSGSKVG